jgi:hypothetical protein
VISIMCLRVGIFDIESVRLSRDLLYRHSAWESGFVLLIGGLCEGNCDIDIVPVSRDLR